jgi:hypothetical protein
MTTVLDSGVFCVCPELIYPAVHLDGYMTSGSWMRKRLSMVSSVAVSTLAHGLPGNATQFPQDVSGCLIDPFQRSDNAWRQNST